MIFRQLLEYSSKTYTYLLACSKTKEAIIIDSVVSSFYRDAKLIKELKLNLIYAINTHVHADHVTGNGMLKKKFFPHLKTGVAKASGAKADIYFQNNDYLKIGETLNLEIRATPGHTDGCVTFVEHNHKMAFTGDALLIRGCGRTDFQQGDAQTLYRSVHNKILNLPKNYKLYPAHDYNGLTVTTVEEELNHNIRLTKTESEFIKIMKNLYLERPKQIDIAVPANLVCGIPELMNEELKNKVFGENI